eukprot:jgi/Chlat1/2022/Chrsp158S02302
MVAVVAVAAAVVPPAVAHGPTVRAAWRELPDLTFKELIGPEGDLSIVGFGSLLSERSARSTFSTLKNFRQARLQGFRRVFAHVAPIFFERGIANKETKEMSSLSVEPCENMALMVTQFEVDSAEIPKFVKREHEFRFLAVTPETIVGGNHEREAVVCARYSDEEYRRFRCKDDDEYYLQYGRWGVEQIWRDDIFPCRLYLRHCFLAAQKLGAEASASFLDHTFLADRITTIRTYLAENPSIMDEPDQPELARRYGG